MSCICEGAGVHRARAARPTVAQIPIAEYRRRVTRRFSGGRRTVFPHLENLVPL